MIWTASKPSLQKSPKGRATNLSPKGRATNLSPKGRATNLSPKGRVVCTLALAFCLTACVTTVHKLPPDVEDPITIANRPAPELLSAQNELLKNSAPAAFQKADTYLKQHSGPNNNVLFALFLRGQAAEQMEQFEKAIVDYRAALSLTLLLNQRDQALVLYRLLNCYEGLGQSAHSLAALHDIELRAQYLPQEISYLEIPARYASIYTRGGQQKQAEAYFKIFSDRLKNPQDAAVLSKYEPSALVGFDSDYGHKLFDSTVVLPRLLYHIGKLSSRSITLDELRSGYDSLGHAQEFLYQAIVDAKTENSLEWAEKSANELYDLYEQALKLVQEVPLVETPDPLVGQVEQQRMKKKLASILLVRMSQLQALQKKFAKNAGTQALQARLAPLEAALTEIVYARPNNEHLTEESLRRQRLPIQGLPRKNGSGK